MSQVERPDPAPAQYRYCPRCAAGLETRQVGDRPRRACPSCGFIYFTDPKVGVGMLLIRDDRLLLVKRSMEPERGKWSLPAGFVDRGEDPRLTAVREVWEETGLLVEPTSLIDVYFNPRVGQVGASIFILYAGRIVGGHMQAGDDAAAVAFFEREALPELAFASTRDAVRRWFEAGDGNTV